MVRRKYTSYKKKPADSSEESLTEKRVINESQDGLIGDRKDREQGEIVAEAEEKTKSGLMGLINLQKNRSLKKKPTISLGESLVEEESVDESHNQIDQKKSKGDGEARESGITVNDIFVDVAVEVEEEGINESQNIYIDYAEDGVQGFEVDNVDVMDVDATAQTVGNACVKSFAEAEEGTAVADFGDQKAAESTAEVDKANVLRRLEAAIVQIQLCGETTEDKTNALRQFQEAITLAQLHFDEETDLDQPHPLAKDELTGSIGTDGKANAINTLRLRLRGLVEPSSEKDASADISEGNSISNEEAVAENSSWLEVSSTEVVEKGSSSINYAKTLYRLLPVRNHKKTRLNPSEDRNTSIGTGLSIGKFPKDFTGTNCDSKGTKKIVAGTTASEMTASEDKNSSIESDLDSKGTKKIVAGTTTSDMSASKDKKPSIESDLSFCKVPDNLADTTGDSKGIKKTVIDILQEINVSDAIELLRQSTARDNLVDKVI